MSGYTKGQQKIVLAYLKRLTRSVVADVSTNDSSDICNKKF